MRAIGVVLATAVLGMGCYHYVAPDNAGLHPVIHGDRARITKIDGTTLELRHAVLLGDTLAGDLAKPQSGAGRLVIPMDSILKITVRRFDLETTAGLALLTGCVVGVATGFLEWQWADPGW